MENTKRLKLVEEVSKLFGNIRLDNALVIACQHLLTTNYSMFLSLFDKGLKPENTYLLGKCYSTDKRALQMFVNKGVKVHVLSSCFDSHKSFDEEYSKQVIQFLIGIKGRLSFKSFKKIILIDDGGFLIETANRLLKNCKNMTGVEQTSSGYERIKDLQLNFPIINVARSMVKLKYESPIIAKQFVGNLKHELRKLRKFPKRILILGYGPIGREISYRLKNNFIVKIYDPFSDKSDFKDSHDVEVQINTFDLLIGCSGKNSIPLNLYGSLKEGAVLVSASSSDREFAAPDLRRLICQYNDCHMNVRIRDVTLLNSGFPLTFSKNKMGVTSKEIQLTRSLIFSAVCLAMTKRYPKGIIELDIPIQNFICKSLNLFSRN